MNISHQYILPIHSLTDKNGTLEYHMPNVAGESLYEYINRKGGISEPEAIEIAIKIASALAYVQHETGQCHANLSPHNILINENGELKIFNFSLNSSTQGTDDPAYTSPEVKQRLFNCDVRSDIYSLGILIFFMMTSKDLKSPGPVSNISKELLIILGIMTSEDRSLRYDDWTLIINKLKKRLKGKRISKSDLKRRKSLKVQRINGRIQHELQKAESVRLRKWSITLALLPFLIFMLYVLMN